MEEYGKWYNNIGVRRVTEEDVPTCMWERRASGTWLGDVEKKVNKDRNRGPMYTLELR